MSKKKESLSGYDRTKYTDEQWAWCMNYENRTGFDPMMDAFEIGEMSFYKAARRAIDWYESHSSDAFLAVSGNVPGWEEAFA